MTKPRSFIVALVLEGRRVVVIGSGAEASSRARTLAESGASVVVYAEAPGPELTLMSESGEISLQVRAATESDLTEAWLVVVAERAPELVARLGPLCAARRCLFLAVDQPEWNSVNHVATARSGSVSVAVSTDGRVPALAKRLREELERVFRDAGLSGFAERVARLRDRTPAAARGAVTGRAVASVRLGPLELPDLEDEAP